MLSKPLSDLLNAQINHELYSSYLYLAMSAYCESNNYPGFAKWMHVQSSEETKHAMKIYSHVHELGGTVTLLKIEQPPADFKSPSILFQQALEHERKISGLITSLYEAAIKEKSYPTQIMLEWFITEQVEEEKTAADIVAQFKMVGDTPVSIMMMDRQLGLRSGQ